MEGGEKTRGYLVSSQTGLGWEECGGRRRLEGTLSPHRRDWVGRSVEGRRLEGTLSPHRRDWVGRSVEGGGED